jgi:flagellin-like protein
MLYKPRRIKILNSEGVSPVIGVLLMVGVTVILALIIAVFVLDLGTNQSSPATAGVEFSETADGVEVLFVVSGTAEEIEIVANGIVLTTWDSDDVGTRVTVTGVGPSDTLVIRGQNGGSSTVIENYVVQQPHSPGTPSLVTAGPTPPVGPSPPPSDTVVQAFGYNAQRTSVSSGTHLTSTSSQAWMSNDKAQLNSADTTFALDDEHAYTARGGRIYALNQATGVEVWNVPYSNDRMAFHLSGGVLVTTDAPGYDVVGLNKTNGTVEYTVTGYTSPIHPVFHDEGAGRLGFAASSGEYVIINSVDGSVVDTYTYPSGAVYAVADDGTTRYLLTETAVVAQDISSGTTQWTYTTDVQSSVKGFIGVDSGRIFFQSGAGLSDTDNANERLRALDAGTGALEWTAPDATARSSEGTVVAHPTVQIGSSYVYTKMDLDDDANNGVDEWVALDKTSGTLAHTFANGETVNFIEADDDIVVSSFVTDEVYTVTPGTWAQSNVIATSDYALVFPGDTGELYMYVSDGFFGNRDVYKYES